MGLGRWRPGPGVKQSVPQRSKWGNNLKSGGGRLDPGGVRPRRGLYLEYLFLLLPRRLHRGRHPPLPPTGLFVHDIRRVGVETHTGTPSGKDSQESSLGSRLPGSEESLGPVGGTWAESRTGKEGPLERPGRRNPSQWCWGSRAGWSFPRVTERPCVKGFRWGFSSGTSERIRPTSRRLLEPINKSDRL